MFEEIIMAVNNAAISGQKH